MAAMLRERPDVVRYAVSTLRSLEGPWKQGAQRLPGIHLTSLDTCTERGALYGTDGRITSV